MKGGHHLFGVVICAALASVACGDQPDAKSATGGATPSSGTLASDFSAQDTNGATLHLSDYLGKDVVLLDFWATWCQPCLEEMPHLRRIYEANKSRGFVVIGVSMDGPETVAEVPSFETDRTETPSPVNSLGVKGVGEAGTIAATPAVTNAVIDALRPLGVNYIDMPLTPMRVWQAIEQAKGGAPT